MKSGGNIISEWSKISLVKNVFYSSSLFYFLLLCCVLLCFVMFCFVTFISFQKFYSTLSNAYFYFYDDFYLTLFFAVIFLCTSRQTAKFIAETGISLAMDDEKLPKMYGVLTPSTGLGSTLLERLRLKGVDFYIGEHKK